MENIRADGEVSYCKGRSNLANLKWQGARPIYIHSQFFACHIYWIASVQIYTDGIFILKANVIHFCTIFADALKFTICHVIWNYKNHVIWTKVKGHPVVMRLWTSMGSWRGFIIYIIANVSIKIGNLGVLYSTTVCTFIERGWNLLGKGVFGNEP